MMSMGNKDSYQSKRELIFHDIERMVHFFSEEGLGMGLRFMAPNMAQLETPEVLLSLVKQDLVEGPTECQRVVSLKVHDLVESVERVKLFGGRWEKPFEYIPNVSKAVCFSPEGHTLHLYQEFTFTPTAI